MGIVCNRPAPVGRVRERARTAVRRPPITLPSETDARSGGADAWSCARAAGQGAQPRVDLRVALGVGRTDKLIGRQRVRCERHVAAQRDRAPVRLWREDAHVRLDELQSVLAQP